MKVLRSFRDKTDKLKPYKKDGEYTHKNEKRTNELIKLGFIEKPKEEPKEEAPKKSAPKKEKTKDNE